MVRKIVFFLIVVMCATPWMGPPLALFAGLILAQTWGSPYPELGEKTSKRLLQISIVGLGFGMNLQTAIASSLHGMVLIVGSIFFTLALGIYAGRLLRVNGVTALLISVGTAICGGSAIAAVSPILKARPSQITVALGTVFMLNALALFLFPFIGHLLSMDQERFGLWAAIAIHDTSSVVGAGQAYGPQALELAVTIKLARALWIFPVSLGVMFFNREGGHKLYVPWFILGFLLSMVAATYLPQLHVFHQSMSILAKKLLVVTLFLVGTGMTRENIREVGGRPFLLGVLLWLAVSLVSLLAIMI